MYHYAAAARPPFCKYCCSDDPVCPSAWVQQCRTTELACDEAAAAAATALFAVQVMVAMELCTNGALREALKLNISWPLKVIRFYSLRFLIAWQLVSSGVELAESAGSRVALVAGSPTFTHFIYLARGGGALDTNACALCGLLQSVSVAPQTRLRVKIRV